MRKIISVTVNGQAYPNPFFSEEEREIEIKREFIVWNTEANIENPMEHIPVYNIYENGILAVTIHVGPGVMALYDISEDGQENS